MIAIGSDHAGYELKRQVMDYLKEQGYELRDFGAYSLERTSYVLHASLVAQSVASGDCERGILICGTGIGISIAANKVPGIRAALCSDTYSARMTRQHNDANILCMGARVLGEGLALDIVDAFLDAQYEGGRHQERLNEIAALEKEVKNR
ncbi:MAG: ribose 5-phosphate isomerase B [Christensenellales bacterium]|jgi:ribose 5-phosphate isomerase B